MVKRFNLDLAQEQYDFIRSVATEQGTSVAEVLRQLIAEKQAQRVADTDIVNDPLYRMDFMFDGDPDLSVNHDHYLYGFKKKS